MKTQNSGSEFFITYIIKKRPENQSVIPKFVDPQGFEPQLAVPKTEVLPLHHGSVFILVVQI